MKIKTKILFFFYLTSISIIAQNNDFQYTRAIKNVTKTWHTLILPDSMFSHTNKNLSDIRILGITEKDTLEAAYMFLKNPLQKSETTYDFRIINKVTSKEGSYFTLQLNKPEIINQIILNIENSNFNWELNLQGSNNQKKWFNILKKYRILGITNPMTRYKFTTLYFSQVKYQYYRIFIKTTQKIKFKNAKIKVTYQNKLNYKNYKIKSYQISENRNKKETIIAIKLENPVPVSRITLNMNSSFEYYRPITIDYILDSLKTESKTIYTYNNLYKGTLSSVEKADFTFNEKILQSIRIQIKNADNQVLAFNGFEVKGIPKKLLVRFTNPTIEYKIYYGNKQATTPQYDLKFFKNIPKESLILEIGKETIIKNSNKENTAIFTNKAWIWISMGFLIVLLGAFSFNMIQKK